MFSYYKKDPLLTIFNHQPLSSPAPLLTSPLSSNPLMPKITLSAMCARPLEIKSVEPVSKLCSRKTFPQNSGDSLNHFYTYLLKYQLDFNDTRLTKQNTLVIPSHCCAAFIRLLVVLSQSRVLCLSGAVLRTTFSLAWSHVPVKSPSGPLRLQGHLKTLSTPQTRAPV